MSDSNEAPSQEIQPAEARKLRRLEALTAYFSLLVYADPTWLDYLLLVVGTVTAAAAGVPFPVMGIIFGELLDDLDTATCEADAGADAAALLQGAINEKVLNIVYIGIAGFALVYVYVVTWAIFSRRLETRLRDLYFKTLLRQDASFFDKRQSGELAARLNGDIQAVQSGTSEKVGFCIGVVAFFLTAYIVSFTRNWKLACMLLSLIPAFLGMAAVGSAFTQKYTAAMSDAIASASSIAQETVSHLAVVQAFSAGPRLEGKFATNMLEAQKQGINKALVAAVQAGALYFIAYSANALAFWQGSRQIAATMDDSTDSSGVSVGQIYTVIFLLVDACVVLGSIAPILPLLGSAAASFQKLRADIETPSAINSASEEGLKLLAPIQGNVVFQNVSFAYVSGPDQPVLKNVSFQCPAGKHTALVGLSGSGKSTVAGLTARLYDPTEGRVCIDGHDLRNLNVKSLRSFMSLVQQEPSLLDRSVLENIALGMVNSPQPEHDRFQPILLSSILSEIVTKVRNGKQLSGVVQTYGQDVIDLVDLVRHAASLADAAAFIERLDHGYGTLVGTGGKLVSGGQRQRIALARALIRDPKILILDEATASLDSSSEHRIQMAIEAIAQGRTVIAIAHRLSTIKHADNIIVMNQGTILEQGTHAELMALNGTYAGMVRLQSVDADDGHSLSSTAPGDADAVGMSERSSLIDEKRAATEQTCEKHDLGGEAKDVAPEQELDSSKSTLNIVKTFSRMMRPNLLWFVMAVISAVIVGATFSASGLIFGHTVGAISPCHSESQVIQAGMLFGGMFFMLGVVELFAYGGSWSGFGYVSEKLLYKIRVLSFRSLYEQGLEWHQSRGRVTTSLLSVITADAAAVGSFSGHIMGTVFSIVVNFMIAIIMCHIINWKIAIVCLTVVPVLVGSGIMQLRALSNFERKHAGAFSNAVGLTVEAVNSFKTVSALSLEEEVMATYRRSLKAPRKEMALASAYTNIWLAVAQTSGNLIYAFAYWWGSTRITKGEATQTQFFVILVSMLVSAQLWGQMFTLAPEFSRAKGAASRILSLLDMGSLKKLSAKESELLPGDAVAKDVEAAAEGPVKPAGVHGSNVTFRNVAFAYRASPHIPVLKDLSLTVKEGQFCGLVGPSGAGKSTILSLVQRMYTPTSGTVEIDGVDISTREGDSFRDDIAVVPQGCALFDGTIRFNVGLGARRDREATQSEIEHACKLANIHDTIMSLPDGYETECGPNGSRLSGGQRQRLAIARALVRKPRLLLLDESTSALDAESERLLQEGLEQAARGITVIAITHRLHTVRKANVIFVVEGGQVVERGRHEELVETSETYRVNALQQMLGS